jgi:hypothetical protein
MLEARSLERALLALGEVLTARGLAYDLVAIGGSGLMLLGLVQRPTRDVDIVAIVSSGAYASAKPLPEPLAEAALDIGEAFGLGDAWLNAGPTDLLDFGLPQGFESRTITKAYGALTIHVASRFDQIHFKLYAAADDAPSGRHAQDLRKLEPTRAELLDAARWAMTHDTSEGFRSILVGVLRAFGLEDADDVL